MALYKYCIIVIIIIILYLDSPYKTVAEKEE